MKKHVQLHAKDVTCYQENEEYYLNRFPKRAKTEGMVYYFQKIDGVIVKTEITVEQWKELYLFNKRLYRSNLKHYDDRYFARFPIYHDEDGDEADPMEYQADTESFYNEADACERLDLQNILMELTEEQQNIYTLSYIQDFTQEEIAKQLNLEQYQVSRILKELDEIIYTAKLDNGTRDEITLKVDYAYDYYRRTGKLEHLENVAIEDFLSNLLPEEDERIRCWFYTESELYRYGIKFLLRYKLEDYSTRNVYTEMFSLKDLSARGYFLQFMTDLPLEYQWLYLHLQKEIEGRQELFKKPKERKHARFIKELKAIAKKANTTPMEYFEKTFLLYLESKCSKQNLAYAKKELGFYVVKENDLTPIPEQLKKVIKSLPKKVRERLESLKRK
ncbi:MAG: sigma-70 family RNA polymerase sigma factor [Clostridia bacterium]|nr:sigma-70 family RNA polymerase sigma factor [Clostridia bacterium]